MATDLGKITITMNGEYDPEVEYERLCCVRYMRATWVSTQTTKGNEPTDESEFWEKISDDGYTSTVVKYNIQVSPSLWRESTTYDGYHYEASFNIEGITASSICSVLFELEDLLSNNFAPVCESFYGGVTIYAKRMPKKIVKISSIRADKYYNQDDLIPDSIKNSVNEDISNLSGQLLDIISNVIDVQQSTIFAKNITLPRTKWKDNFNERTDAYQKFADIRLEEDCGVYLKEGEDFERDYTATVVYGEMDATSQLYSPVVETFNSGADVLGYTGKRVIRIYGKKAAASIDMTIPLIKLEKVSISSLKQNEVSSDDKADDN